MTTTVIQTSTVTLTWQAYDRNDLVTRSVPVLPDGAVEMAAYFGEIPGVRNPCIDATRAVQLGDVPTPRYGWEEAERHEVPMFPLAYAAQAVSCPKCKQPGGIGCSSTGGGNAISVPTHRTRTARVAGWTNAVQEHAAMLVRTVGHHGYARQCLFAVFELAAAPIPTKSNGQPTPKGVRLSEKQAEEIERAVHGDGTLYYPTAHFHGCADIRKTINALESKGIVEFVRGTDDYYGRIFRLTPFGWQVYRQHRLIIRRLTEAEVDALEAKAGVR